jgi:hypothetical protein
MTGFSSLTQRINNKLYDRETLEELSYIVDESKDPADTSDTLLELSLSDTISDYESNDEDDYSLITEENDELLDELSEEDLENLGSEDDLSGDLDELSEDEDDDLNESTKKSAFTKLKPYELAI